VVFNFQYLVPTPLLVLQRKLSPRHVADAANGAFALTALVVDAPDARGVADAANGAFALTALVKT
jgi:hypothetical protein